MCLAVDLPAPGISEGAIDVLEEAIGSLARHTSSPLLLDKDPLKRSSFVYLTGEVEKHLFFAEKNHRRE